MADDRYRISLGELFEGPMDLLVHLIRKNQVNIYDVPISLITDQYLAYIRMLEELNIDVAGDFLVMAATLAYIKSRMLLPVHETDEEETEDPRREITGPLIEYLRMRSAAEELGQRHLLGEHTFKRPSLPLDPAAGAEPELIQVGLFELIDAFKRILENLSDSGPIDLTRERKTVKERMTEVLDLLEANGSMDFPSLFQEKAERADVVVTFLAILEMVKMRLIRIVQQSETGILHLIYS